MLDTKEFCFKLVINDLPPVLANDAYWAVPKKFTRYKKDGSPYTRMMATTAATPALKTYQATMKDLLQSLIDDTTVIRFTEFFHRRTEKDYGIRITIHHEVRSKQIFEFDLSNTVKSFEDCIVRRVGVDDKYHTQMILEKSINDDMQYDWRITMTYEMVDIRRNSNEEGSNEG